MATQLYLAPAGHGKTAYALDRIRQARLDDPLKPIIVVLPNQAQVSAFRQRLSAAGGALGVSLGTFYTLYPEILAWAGKPEPRLPEPVQYRLLRSIIMRLTDAGRLPHYAPLRDKPGFVVAVRGLLEELKRAGIRREAFNQAIQSLAIAGSRLTELAEIYTVYQDWLLDYNWADTEGQGWLAALRLERQPDAGRHLHLLIVDGFDEFNPTQLDVLKLLAGRAAETIVTLTGSLERPEMSRAAFRRFKRALESVSQALNLEPQPLPQPATVISKPQPPAPALAYLEANLFVPQALPFAPSANGPPAETTEPMTFVEVQNRAEEVRAGLRWLKARLVRDQMAPAEVALIARDLSPYRPFIEEIAGEFGLTLHLRQGLNLATNPAVSALMSLLALPLAGHTEAGGNWARRPLIEAWRSPYFENLAPEMRPRDADRLEAVARQGRVIQGLDQWREALARQLERANHQEAGDSAARLDDEEEFNLSNRLAAARLLALQMAFEAFVTRLSPSTPATLRQFAAFVEDLIGDDPLLAASNPSSPKESQNEVNSLDIVKRAQAVTGTKSRDIAALRAFKDVLRGLVLAESSLRQSSGQATARTISYEQFYEDLYSALQGAIYYLPPPVELAGAIPVLSVLNARGLSFRAVALIGLAEGEFPRSEREDILLREEDRAALQRAGLTTLDTRLRGDEITFFYQTVTRAREKLLLCRPYLADDGQTWEPSPYWQELRRLFDPPVQHLRPEDPLVLTEVASPQEFTQTLARFERVDLDLSEPTPAAGLAHILAHVLRSAAVLNARLAAEPQSPFEGDLTGLSDRLAAVYGPEHVWSSSRLEAYGLCPHHFWLWQDLALEPRQPPVEGFDIFILGGMYHEILEEVYREAGAQAGGERLLELLPPIAQSVFDAAPETYGFRPTPLWAMQRRELEQIVAQSLTALAEATANNTPLAQEQVFGMRDQPPLVIKHSGDEIRVRGFIDRVDQDAKGRLCIIDYKSGSTPIAARDLSEGRRLQIALYALAARDALGLGEIAGGFYWHIGSARPSSLTLDKFDGGVAAALKTAIAHTFEHVTGIRAGRFAPTPPAGGCPGHCPGASFCWQYKAKGY